MWELCNGWHSKNRDLTECIISRCGIAFSDSPPLIDWAQHSPFITRAEAWSRRSAIINSLLSFIQNSRVGQIRMLFLQLYRGQNIHKVSIQLDLGWLAQPNSKGLHDKISMNNCCFEKKKYFHWQSSYLCFSWVCWYNFNSSDKPRSSGRRGVWLHNNITTNF